MSRQALGHIQAPNQGITWDLSPGVRLLRHEVDYSLPSGAEVKNGGAIPPVPLRLHVVVLN
jgi:hypothetical protein